MAALKNRVLIELTGRFLTNDEADQVRADVAAMKPRVHLITANWRWLEVRGINAEKAARLIALLKAFGLKFRKRT